MAVNFMASENDVYTRLAAHMAPVPVVDTEERDEALDVVGATGTFTPFVGIAWSSPMHTGTGQGIVKYSDDPHMVYFVFRAVAPDMNTCKFLFNKGFQFLTDLTPLNGTMIKSANGWAYTVGGNGAPKRYYREQQFSYYTNMGAV